MFWSRESGQRSRAKRTARVVCACAVLATFLRVCCRAVRVRGARAAGSLIHPSKKQKVPHSEGQAGVKHTGACPDSDKLQAVCGVKSLVCGCECLGKLDRGKTFWQDFSLDRLCIVRSPFLCARWIVANSIVMLKTECPNWEKGWQTSTRETVWLIFLFSYFSTPRGVWGIFFPCRFWGNM